MNDKKVEGFRLIVEPSGKKRYGGNRSRSRSRDNKKKHSRRRRYLFAYAALHPPARLPRPPAARIPPPRIPGHPVQ